MPLHIIRNDITKIECDAIVNPSNRYLEPGGGADLAIHEAAGKELYEYCKALGGCEVGKAKITPAFKLPCKYIIHTAGPNWLRLDNPEDVLVSCYTESLKLAIENNCTSIATPLIGAGSYGCPKETVLKVATKVINRFLDENDLTVYLVVYDKSAFHISRKLFKDITVYIDDNYISEHSESAVLHNEYEYHCQSLSREELKKRRKRNLDEIKQKALSPRSISSVPYDHAPKKLLSLDDMMSNLDESFSQMLLRKIDEKGMTDAQCYKKANVDRKLFSKIRNDINYHPKKSTVIAFAIALELDITETKELLSKAGFALSHSNEFDIIIEYFIINKIYNIFEINETLFAFDQVLLGV